MSSGSTSMAPMEAAGQGPGLNGEDRMTVIDELIKDLGAGKVVVGSNIPARNSADPSGFRRLRPGPLFSRARPRMFRRRCGSATAARAADGHPGRTDGPCGRRPPQARARWRCRWSA